MLETHGSDAVRYWAASSRLGTDAAFDPQNPTQIKIGRRLAIKVLNAAKFIHGAGAPATPPVTERRRPEHARVALGGRAPGHASRSTTTTTPARSRSPRRSSGPSATTTSSWSRSAPTAEPMPRRSRPSPRCTPRCRVFLRLFAPFVPFATEEAWSWSNDGSVHVAAWPNEVEIPGAEDGVTAVLDLASRALTAIRRAKTDAKVSQRTPVISAVIAGTGEQVGLLETGRLGPRSSRTHRRTRFRGSR